MLSAQPITHPGDLTMCGSSALHNNCAGGRKALARAVDQAPDAAELKSYKKSHPLEWKYKELELRMSSSGLCGRRRGAAEKQLAVKILEEVRRYSKMSVRHRVFLLGEKPFIQWYVREEGMSPEAAAAKWTASLGDPRIFQTKEFGTIKIAVRGHTEYVHEEGVERSKKLQKQDDHDGDAKNMELNVSPDADHFGGLGKSVFQGAMGGGASDTPRREKPRGSASSVVSTRSSKAQRRARSESCSASEATPPRQKKWVRGRSTDDLQALSDVPSGQDAATRVGRSGRRAIRGSPASSANAARSDARTASSNVDDASGDSEDERGAGVFARSARARAPVVAPRTSTRRAQQDAPRGDKGSTPQVSIIKEKKETADVVSEALKTMTGKIDAITALLPKVSSESVLEYDLTSDVEAAKALVGEVWGKLKQAKALKAGLHGGTQHCSDVLCVWPHVSCAQCLIC